MIEVRPKWFTADAEHRFWENIPFGDAGKCWEWLGRMATNGYGYGSAYDNKTQKSHQFRAHRMMAILCGFAEAGKDVMHDCDNRMCVNPCCLRSGSRKQNMRDCIERGRFVSSHKKVVKFLTEREVESVISDWNKKEISNKAICEKYGIAYPTLMMFVARYKEANGLKKTQAKRISEDQKREIGKRAAVGDFSITDISSLYRVNPNHVVSYMRSYIRSLECAV